MILNGIPLCTFQDDRYFLSGSLDGKIRLWNIPEKKVALWNEIDGSGTSSNFTANHKCFLLGNDPIIMLI